MIAFVTLLLGLISGAYPIEVTVGGPVVSVEYLLDGVSVAELKGPPWVARVELGAEIRPRELTARALGADGQEIARVTQWLNLPRPPAEVEIVLEKGMDGAPRAAQLTWQSVNGVKPASLGLTLDGQPLEVDGEGRAPLPATDLKILHVLTAELWFPPGLLARKDVVFGGEYGSEVSTELTAVPVRVSKGAALPPPQGLAGWFTAEGQSVSVAAVEDGPGKVIVVRVPSATEIVDKLVPPRQRAVLLPAFRTEMRLGPEDRVRFLSLASSAFRESKVPAELFDLSRELSREDGGVFWYLTSVSLVKQASRDSGRRVTDAVAVAGLQAAVDNHRRAVVLLLDGKAADDSRYSPAVVRRYLESIHVPLFVWSLYGTRSPAAKAWGGAEDVSSIPGLSHAVARLRDELDSQRIVWLEGLYLPQSIGLTPAAQGVELPRTARVP
ncbi:MAG: hypothetical protein QOF89_1789 [Acidobacteriota bacterium]|jgi:hypothetical protein|nr:hypothetical protein [Acidobacteriota bacterium]